MKLRWLGHSSFIITTSSGTVLTDPYDARMVGYSFSPPPVDTVIVSHGHGDHNCVAAVPGKKQIISAVGEYSCAGMKITGIPSYHDGEHGRRRGSNIIFKLTADGITVCHLGDIGEEATAALIGSIGRVDVLLIPVGGTYTINSVQAKQYADALKPGIVIPMHYNTDGCALDIDGADEFIRLMGGADRTDVSELEIDGVPQGGTQLIVMKRYG